MRVVLLVALALAACKSVNPNGDLIPKPGEDGHYEIRFDGNTSIADGKLLTVIAFDLLDFEKSGFDESFVDDAAFQIGVHYRSEGYPFVEDTYSLEPRPQGPLVTFHIEEGPRVLLTRFDCECVAESGQDEEPAFTEEEMQAFFEGPRTGALGRGELLYIEDNVNRAARVARDAFRPRGFLDVAITPPTVEFSADRTRAAVTMKIEQGRRYHVGRVDLSPGTVIPDWMQDAYREFIDELRKKKKGTGQDPVYSPRSPYELRALLSEELANFGYPDSIVEVVPEVDAAAALVHITVSLDPGVRVRVGEVKFVGNEVSNPRFLAFLRSRVTVQEGDLSSNKAVRNSVSRLYETGLFASVNVELEKSDAPTRALVVTLEEYPAIETFVEPGYGSYDLFRLHAGLRDRNWRGTGLQLRGDATVAVRALRAQLGLRDPWFLRRELIGDLTVSADRRDEPSFSSGGVGAGAFVTKKWTRQNWTTLGYQFRRSTIGDVDVEEDELEDDATDDVNISSVRVTQRLDRRTPNPFLPQGGLFFEASVEQAGDALGSEFDFTRFTGSFAGYKTIREGTVFATALRTGVIVPHDNTVPLQERFYNGGENSVRSYQESELGPQDSDDNPIGGETYTTLSVELRQRLSPRFELAGFVDAGNVSSEYQDYFDFDGVGSAVGLGLRYLLPIGPLRLDLGVNPDPGHDDDDYVLHFAIGMAF